MKGKQNPNEASGAAFFVRRTRAGPNRILVVISVCGTGRSWDLSGKRGFIEWRLDKRE
jgi:hypothetical protein